MRRIRTLGVTALMALSVAAWAQDAGPYAGKWVGTMKSQVGGEVRIDLVLKGTTGTWRMSTPDRMARTRVNPCLERDFPIVVVAQAEGQLQFDIAGDKVIKGCIDQRATLTASDADTLQGRLNDGRALAFSRR